MVSVDYSISWEGRINKLQTGEILNHADYQYLSYRN